MIKVKVNNEYKDVVKIFCGGTLQKEIIKVWSREAQEYVYESSVEYTGSLPITISANGDALLDYRIYGADGGVGEPTENLFDPNDPGIERGYYYGYNNGISTAYGANSWESGWIPVTPGDYTFYLKRTCVGFYLYVNFYNSQKEFVKTIVSVTNPNGFYTRTISDIGYVRFNGVNGYATDWLVARGNVTSYIPYGYKLPMAVHGGNTAQTIPVYIGENQLDVIGEYRDYVDYGTQKIIRRIAKIEFDGSENWQTYLNNVYVGVPNYIKSVWGTCAGFSRSSHYAPSLEAQEIGTYCLGGLIQYKSTRWNGNIVINAGMSTTEYRAYLASQVAAGTPVTFWYVVETPVEQDPPVPLSSLPIIKGETVIDYDGDPKPSQMYIKYRR